jgi:CubicO group peptidase (beta-lactamase class C family)
MTLSQSLHTLIEGEAAKANTHRIILRVCSGDGQVDFKGSAGAAAPETRFAIASITKMFTAALIMRLADEKALRLDQTAQSS